MSYDPVQLEIFKHLLAAIAEEMGVVLRRASYSPNIKERRDFSCAVFDAAGRMAAQAAHIPVHLGSMPLSVEAAVTAFPSLGPGDMVLLNDPFRGGTHLPDITLVTPVFDRETLIGYVACRAHHADVGGMSPGSMPVAREIYQEGLIIPPVRLVRGAKYGGADYGRSEYGGGEIESDLLNLVLANVRTPQERYGDLMAQIAANRRGAERLAALVKRYGLAETELAMSELIAYTERLTRRLLVELPDGAYRFCDALDDDGAGGGPVIICAEITISGDRAVVDFSGSAPQQAGSVNAVLAITLSAVYYVFRCLLGLDAPNNAGCMAPIQVIAPPGSVVNALSPAPVAGGNVETSQRIVDVLLGALAQAAPGRIPAASQGTMNNLTIGGRANDGEPFAYYETVGGGMGARPDGDGFSAVHSHMTNTLNTPAEALEFAYPLRVLRYEVRLGSGGAGKYHGGDGIRRDIQVLVPAQATLLSERRKTQPYGLEGGEPGKTGENVLIRDGKEQPLPGKGSVDLEAGDVISLRTPGGGGHGAGA